MLKRSSILVLSTLPFGAFPAGTGFSPGLYEYVTTTDGSARETSRHCVTPAEAEKGVELPAAGDGCKAVRSVMAGGKIDILQTCKDSSMSAVGSYSATTFVIDGKIQGKVGGQSFSVATHTTAKRLAATCKAGDE